MFVVPREATKWKTSRLGDIIAIGMASERELNIAYQGDHRRKTKHFSGQRLHFGELKRSSTASNDGNTLLSDAAPPAKSWSNRWITDAQGTRAIPVQLEEGSNREVESGWTTAVPKSPVRLRTDDAYGVK